jgi:hypothetical protein
MNWRKAHRLAAKIRRQCPGIVITIKRGEEWPCSWEIHCVDYRSGENFIISDPKQWAARCYDSRVSDAIYDWSNSPGGRAWAEAAARAMELGKEAKE